MRSKQVRTSKLDWSIVVRWGFCLSTTYIEKVRVSVCCDFISPITQVVSPPQQYTTTVNCNCS